MKHSWFPRRFALAAIAALMVGLIPTSMAMAAADHFVISGPTVVNAGVGHVYTVTAMNGSSVDTTYTGHVTLTGGPTDSHDFIVADGGVWTVDAFSQAAGDYTFLASDTVISGTLDVTVVAETAATHFVVTVTGSPAVGVPVSLTVTAKDEGGATDTTYAGTVHLTSSDGSATLPANFTLVSGTRTFTNGVTFETAGSQTVTATDTVTVGITGTSASVVVQTVPTITWADPADIVYGTALSGTQLDATASVPGTFDYTPPIGTILDAGNSQALTVNFTPNDAVNYTAQSKIVHINVSKLDITVTANTGQSKVYGDADPTLTYGHSPALIGTDSFTGNLARAAGENVGSAYAINQGNLALSSNYTLTFVSHNFAITARPITVTATSGQTKRVGTLDPVFTYTVTAGSLVGSDAFTGALSRAVGETVGPWAITQGTLALSANYALSFVSANFTITAKLIPTFTWADPADIVYGTPLGITQLNASAPSTPGTFVYTPLAGTVLAAGAAQILSVTFTPTDTVNYDTATAIVHINVTALPITVTVNSGQSKVYGGADPTPWTYTVTTGALVGADAFTGALDRAPGETVAPYAISQGTLAIGANYTVTFVPANFSITARPVTVTADSGLSKTAGATDPVFTYTITGSLVGSDAFSGVLGRAAGEAAGVYAITQGTLSLGPNYTLSFVSANFTINPISSYYKALTPARLLDTRIGIGLKGSFSSHQARTFQVWNRGGVAGNAVAVTGNLTVTQQTSAGFLYVGPDPVNNPTSSNLNFPLGDDRANAVFVALSTNGTLGITFAAGTLGPTAQVIFDVTGYFTPDSGDTYVPLAPTRLLDTRDGTGLGGAFSSHAARNFSVANHGGVAANATAVTGNLTVTQQTSAGFLYIGPSPMNNPTSSTLNFPMGDDRANAVTVALGSGGSLSVTYAAPTLGPTAHVIFDVTGYFSPDPSGAKYVPLTPTRLLDTRVPTGLSGPFSSHTARPWQVGGLNPVPSAATAVTGNLTVTQQTSAGFLYIGPSPMNNPTSSTLNFPMSDDRANAVAVALGSGSLAVTYAAGTLGPTAHVIFDVTGYFTH